MIRTTIAGTLLCKLSSLLGQVREGYHDGITILKRLQRNGIAAAGLSHTLRVNGRSTVFTDDAGCALVKADAAADGAGVKDRNDLVIGFTVEQEANPSAVYVSSVALQFALRQVFGR